MAFVSTTSTFSTSPVALPLRTITSLPVRLLNLLIAWEARWCQARRMDQLSDDARRDMGLPCLIKQPRLPDYGW
ncbi:hypothetical protein PZ897_06475 [Hoeflea sp. YIM 152468]|uniref:hypothetical protein n=1 Tax=Hoeflea sp. YIM 152468 TaxID=3031759 RepID=UPI0023DBF083|nr:hypothetical protein [Hoeflea sp. YIM 152468]MDF1607817.1 hypothetical protein [Hoeflea sp. YIM 152468]